MRQDCCQHYAAPMATHMVWVNELCQLMPESPSMSDDRVGHAQQRAGSAHVAVWPPVCVLRGMRVRTHVGCFITGIGNGNVHRVGAGPRTRATSSTCWLGALTPCSCARCSTANGAFDSSRFHTCMPLLVCCSVSLPSECVRAHL